MAFNRKVITLPDGYNGHSAEFYVEPIAYDGELVQLRCAEPGREYQTRWAHSYDVKAVSYLAVGRS